ncbi:outer membrane protein assembly factor BamE domain-containing protein [Winogradskyella arenosi]|uniref:Outer membrane protein assembly factor BamE domain-containing protein n=1 Tax=Winogradskyella arenosi TaxID=533325 RepID=A0A368ZJB3_9FLAO|nr:outer membrane protein assembly factor BamE [Winogradskyella arenosi]RCW93824.1 hypothetical protein DFQ08_101622 [Winogradskyella arenosi]
MPINKPSLEKQPKKKKAKPLTDYFDFRNNQVNQIGLILFSAFVISRILIYQFNERFDAQRWRTQHDTRAEMVDDVMDRELFLGESKAYVIKELGKPIAASTANPDAFYYYIGLLDPFSAKELSELVLVFENDKVVKIYLQPWHNRSP